MSGTVVWQSRWGLPMGYAIHSEEMASHLVALGWDVIHRASPWPVAGTVKRPELQAALGRPIPETAPQVSYDQADLFHVAHRGWKAGFTMLEVDGLPKEWVDACNRMDEVWVPSRWGAETFAASGVTRPLRVMPLGHDPVRFNTSLPARPVGNRFTFLSVFEWGERKAPEVLLRAYAAAFPKRDDVLLLLRVNNFDGDVNVGAQIADLRLPSDGPPIALLFNQQISPESLGSLYRSADAFVLPTRGEGWGMPVLEAMACGLPVIATDWSGTTEFLREGTGYPLRTRALIPAVAKCPYYAGFRWADPDLDHLVSLMRHVFENRAEARSVGAAAAREAARLTWAETARRISQRLLEVAG